MWRWTTRADNAAICPAGAATVGMHWLSLTLYHKIVGGISALQ